MSPEVLNILLSVLGFLAVYYFKELSSDIKEAVKSVNELNTKVGVIIERTDSHSNEIMAIKNKQDNIVSDVAHIKAHLGRDNEFTK